MDDLAPVRIGDLQKFALSPAHFHCIEPEEEADPDNETAAMEKGKFLHQHVLLGRELTVCPCRRDPRMQQYRDFLEKATAENLLVVTKKQEKHLRGMKAALLRDPVAPPLLEGVREVTLFWQWLGRKCRGTPDVLAPDFITELKSTRCSKPEWFQREADRRGYHNQLAWYEHGAMLNDNRLFRKLWIVAVESLPPYAVTCHEMEEPRWEQAKRNIRLWMERLLQCEAAQKWPAYTEVALHWGLEDRKPWEPRAEDIEPEALA